MTLMVTWPTLTDDDGTGQTGTPVDHAFELAVKTSVEDQVHSSTNPTIKPKSITDEVVAARNGEASLLARLATISGASGLFTDVQITGGLVVGFSSAPVADTIKVGDALFFLDYNAGNPIVVYDSTDYMGYTRASNAYYWAIGSTNIGQLETAGLQVAGGLVVGFAATPTVDEVQVGDANFALAYLTGTTPVLRFDTGGDGILYTRATNILSFLIGGATVATVDAAGIHATLGLQSDIGLVIGYAGTPTADQISLGDASFYLDYGGGSPQIAFNGASGKILYDRGASTISLRAGNSTNEVVVGIGSIRLNGYLEGVEQVAPAAGAVNTGRIFFQDNGGGKTQLMVIFNTGAAQQIAIQP